MSGLTLLELLVALVVSAVLAAMAIPAMHGLIAQSDASHAINQMLGAVQMTRSAAVSYRTTATLCPGPGPDCGPRNTWHLGAMVFLDRNGNGRREPEELIVRALPPLPEGQRVSWRSFRNKPYLSVTPAGYTNWQNGSLTYCPPDNDTRFARQVIINAQGRARRAVDSDADGIAEDARGRPLRCP